jgi:ornithine cyclodeaminase/alanine dehydrogenase-like protein (mu-crystallin family)
MNGRRSWSTAPNNAASLVRSNTRSSKGIKDGDITTEIGEVLIGKKSRREAEIALFDSTGIAVQDIAVANIVYQLARNLVWVTRSSFSNLTRIKLWLMGL